MVLQPEDSSKWCRSCGMKANSMVVVSINLIHFGNLGTMGDHGAIVGFIRSDSKQTVG